MQNLPDAQNHPAFAYRPETGEDPFASLLAVPVRRGGRVLGVLAVQNRAPRRYADDEVELLQTVAMLLAEVLAAAGASDGAEQGIGATMPQQFQATPLAPGIAFGPVVLHGPGAPLRRLLADDPVLETKRLDLAIASMPADARRPDRDPAAERRRLRARCWRRRAWSRPIAAGCAACGSRSRTG